MQRRFSFIRLLALILAFSGGITGSPAAQTAIMPATALPHLALELNDLSAFRKASKRNWKLAGRVFADRQREKHLESTPGTGILVYEPGNKPVRLASRLEHGDLDLEMDFLLPKGGSAGLLLQGRYLLHLQDSWLQATLQGTDCGGITAGSQSYAPSRNATKAPGLWQHLKVSFLAPRFDAQGNKTADARLVEVALNGKVVQEHITLVAPAPGTGREKALAPLVILGQESPVAFKNIQYKTYDARRLKMQNLAFQLQKGRFRQLDKLPQTSPFRTGTTDSLSFRLGGEDELLTVTGEIEVPRTGDYLFRVSAGGPAWILIDHKLVVDNKGSRDYERFFYGGTTLSQGKHPYKVIYSNHDQSLVLHYEGPGIPWTPLTTPASTRKVPGQEPLLYPVAKEPVLQRGFVVHGNRTNTYAAAVGIPGGVNFAYDLNAQAPLSIWHGEFLDIAHMWRERGEKQLALPLGPEQLLPGLPTVARLAHENQAWPDSLEPDRNPYQNKGYRLGASGLPVFQYTLPQMAVEDAFEPTAQKEGLNRQLRLRLEPGAAPAYVLLASGRDIEKLPNGAYAVNNKSYYLEQISGGGEPILRTSRGQQQLLVPVKAQPGTTTIQYSIIW